MVPSREVVKLALDARRAANRHIFAIHRIEFLGTDNCLCFSLEGLLPAVLPQVVLPIARSICDSIK